MTFSPRLLARSGWFWSVIALFLFGNLWTYLSHPECCDQFDRIGFPFPFHLSGGIAGVDDFYPIGLALNIVIALTCAIIAARIGLMFSRED